MNRYDFSEKQRRVLTWWTPGSPDRGKDAIVCDGAVRSGKTLAMGLSFFLWAMVSFQGRQFGVCGKTISSLRRNVLAEVLPRLQAMGAVWRENGRKIWWRLPFWAGKTGFTSSADGTKAPPG